MGLLKKIKKAGPCLKLTRIEFKRLLMKKPSLGFVRKLIIPRVYSTNVTFKTLLRRSLVTQIHFIGKYSVQDRIMIAQNIVKTKTLVDTKVHASELAHILRINQQRIETVLEVKITLYLCLKMVAKKQINRDMLRMIIDNVEFWDWKDIRVPKKSIKANKLIDKYKHVCEKYNRHLENDLKKLKNEFV